MTEKTAQESFGTCPKCKEGLVRKTPKGWGCSRYKEAGCSFVVWEESFGHKVSESELRELLQDGVTKDPVKLKRKDGSGGYEARLRLTEEFKVGPAIVGTADAETFGLCPLCKEGAVVATPKGWGCSRFKSAGCRFGIWAEIAGHTLSAEEVRELLLGGETKKPTRFFSSAKKKSFSARIRLDGAGHTTFIFDDEKKATA